MLEIPISTLCPQHAQMVESEVAALVCPFMAWTRVYVELFLCISFYVAIKMEKDVLLIFPVKDIEKTAFEKFLGAKKYSSIYKFSILPGLDETLGPYN